MSPIDLLFSEIFKGVLKSIFFKNGKFNVKRTFSAALAFLAGAFFYHLPIWFVEFTYTRTMFAHFVGKPDDPEYVRLVQIIFLGGYVILGLGVAILKTYLRGSEIAEISENDRNLIRFAKIVGLKSGSRCANEEEKSGVAAKIAKSINDSKRTRIMLINGYHDLADKNSPIRRALEAKERNLHLQVLLLDPFSTYAKERATQLKQETDITTSLVRYVRDHIKAIAALQELAEKAASVQYRVYCSNPFFRMYIFDHELFLQTYQANRHGNETPLYNFIEDEKSLFHAGKEIFDYYWNKGFLHTDEWLRQMPSALMVYLANQYSLNRQLEGEVVDAFRDDVLRYVEAKETEAEQMDREGKITDLDR